ncbi:MAG: NlpC/P60 family protein [Acidimicrobiia bacterium]
MTIRHRLRRASTVVIAAALVVGAISVVGAPLAGAQGTGDKRKQAEELQNQIEASDVELSSLAEKLHDAESRRDTAQVTVKDAQAQIAAAEAEVERILGLVQQNLASLYRRTLRGSSVNEIDFGSATDLLKRAQYSQAQNDRDDALLDELAAAQDDLEADRDDAARARDAAQAESEQIATAKTAMETARGEQQALLDQITGELAAAVAAEQARREESTKVKFSAGPVSYPDVGSPNGSASQAIAFARGVIGSPYSTNPRFGPSYDCSGLVSSAWRAAGVSVGGSSGSMYASLPHVPMDAIQPGDLIFWGEGGGSHVALYVGGGTIIDASSSQNAVTQRGIWGSPVGAARIT